MTFYCIRLGDHLKETLGGTPPDEDPHSNKKGDDVDDASEYPEPEIDEMRAQRDAALKRYIQVCLVLSGISGL